MGESTGTPEIIGRPRCTRRGSAGAFALGLLAVILAGSALVSGCKSASVTSSPPAGGKRWISVAANGTGQLTGWEAGHTVQVGGAPGEPSGAVLFDDVAGLDTVDGATVWLSTRVYMTASTKIIVDGKPYPQGSSASPAEAFLNDDSPVSVLAQGPLTVDFHLEGKWVVADQISEAIGGENPLQ